MAKIPTNIATAAMPLSFSRDNAIPLDSTEIYVTKEAAEAYAESEAAYVGQTIKVINEGAGTVDVYTIADTNGNLVHMNATPGFAYYSAEAEKASGYIGGGQIDRILKKYAEQIAALQTKVEDLQKQIDPLGNLRT